MQQSELALVKLTFMQQSERWVEWSFSLSEEKQLSIHCQDFNMFMAEKKTKMHLYKETLCMTQRKMRI